jgi:hypothetical protein
MQYTNLRLLDVNDALVEQLWNYVKNAGSFYSIGDGNSKEVFRKALYKSNYVLEAPGVFMHLNYEPSYVELHPILVGHQAIRTAKWAMKAIYDLLGSYFEGKPICCIIPSELESTMKLAEICGMHKEGLMLRPLSGVNVTCVKYSWRP